MTAKGFGLEPKPTANIRLVLQRFASRHLPPLFWLEAFSESARFSVLLFLDLSVTCWKCSVVDAIVGSFSDE
jgi:hypothetical protein